MRAAVLAIVFTFVWLTTEVAHACGCFAPPDPTVPIVQAGERILFSRKDGVVTAHIQIQYAGNAGEFGWLLPLPSQPELRLGTDELFTQLIRTTQPSYRLTFAFDGCPPRGVPVDARAPDASASFPDAGPGDGALVTESSIGPYDYAILRGDSKDHMLAWLRDNHYFIPVGTDDVVGPYIHPGSYFLALKLRSGKTAGDLQPVVVRYASDLPMIPIILTSVAAQPDMGIQVWMLGEGRAIPRNYAHTVLDDAALDWVGGGRNYNDLVIRATREAPGRHTFVTEYAGTSAIMVGILDPPGRFGSLETLAAEPTVLDFLNYINNTGYTGFMFPRAYSTSLLAILGSYIPVPPKLVGRGVSLASFYSNASFWLGTWQQQHPEDFVDWSPRFEPATIAAELGERIVAPTIDAGHLFRDHPYLTRMYTTLSPEHMNRDPVFSENRDLPAVSNIHTGTLTYHCGGQFVTSTTPASLVTEQGYRIEYPKGTTVAPIPNVPASKRIELLGEEGPPGTITDNDALIASVLNGVPGWDAGIVPITIDAGRPRDASDSPVARVEGGGGCAVGAGGGRAGGALGLLAAGAVLLQGAARFRSRRRSVK